MHTTPFQQAQPGTAAHAPPLRSSANGHHPSLIHHMARGRLYRAIVSLPDALCPRGELLHERIVFFDGPRENAGPYLETLLAHAWHVDTIDWCEDGHIYNLRSAHDLIEEGASDDMNARLLGTSWGGQEGIGYAAPERTDFFVAPAMRARLAELQAQVARNHQQGAAA